jgi:hypothetical protein
MAEVLPRLQEHEQVEVMLTLDGRARDYRETDEAPVIRFEAEPRAGAGFGAQDWFDLAVTVSIDGHQVPFEPLFTALAQELPTLLLDNGVYFHLKRSEFAELARLIAESRDLLDAPPGTVRLSRYHASLWDDVENLGEITGDTDVWRTAVQTLSTAAELPTTSRRKNSGPRCGPTRNRASAGWPRCGGCSSAASSPTTWAWARPCRRSH